MSVRRIWIEEGCISCKVCEDLAPQVFVVDGDDTCIVRKDAPDEVVLANGPETEARIARVEVVEMRPGKVSLMPDGMEQVLTRQELADLLAFLKAAK